MVFIFHTISFTFVTAGVRDKPGSGSGHIHGFLWRYEIEQEERQDFVSLGCGTYLNKVMYSTHTHTVHYNTLVIIYDHIVVEPFNNTVRGY